MRDRARDFWRSFVEKVRKKKLLLVLTVVGGLLVDRAQGWANDQIDRLSPKLLRFIARNAQEVLFPIGLLVIVLAVLAVLSWLETRPHRQVPVSVPPTSQHTAVAPPPSPPQSVDPPESMPVRSPASFVDPTAALKEKLTEGESLRKRASFANAIWEGEKWADWDSINPWIESVSVLLGEISTSAKQTFDEAEPPKPAGLKDLQVGVQQSLWMEVKTQVLRQILTTPRPDGQ